MSSCKPLCLVLCLLCTSLSVRGADGPKDNPTKSDSRSSGSMQQTDSGSTKEWGGKSLQDWVRDLHHADPSYRVAALLALPKFKQAADVLPEVVAMMSKDGDAAVRIKAAKLLGWIRPHDTDRTRVIRGLARALHDLQPVVRYDAAVSLQSFCPFQFENKEESDALQDLAACLKNTSFTSSYELREVCIDTLMMARVDPKNGPDARVTEELIAHADRNIEMATRVRVKAIMALGAQGRPRDPKLLQRVMSTLKMQSNFQSKNPSVRIWSHVAVIALEEKVNKKDLEAIAGYLKEREAAVRAEAVMALGSLEDKAKDYVGNILELLEREKIPAVKANAALALGRIKNTGSRVLSALIKLTEEDDRDSILVVLHACQALVWLGVNNAEVMKAMDKVREHKSLEKHQKDIVSKMIEELENPRKKQPAKEAPKAPEKGGAPKQNNRR